MVRARVRVCARARFRRHFIPVKPGDPAGSARIISTLSNDDSPIDETVKRWWWGGHGGGSEDSSPDSLNASMCAEFHDAGRFFSSEEV